MATIYVDSNAGGAADGTSWTDAYTTLQAGMDAWTTGDVIWMAHNHSESGSGAISLAYDTNSEETNPMVVYRVNSGTDAYDPVDPSSPGTANINRTGSGTITIGNTNVDSACTFYGVYFKAANGTITTNNATQTTTRFFDCGLETTGSSAYLQINNQHAHTEFNMGFIKLGGAMCWHLHGYVRYRGVQFQGTSSTSFGLFYSATTRFSGAEVWGCDFSGISNWSSALGLVDSTAANNPSKWSFNHCTLDANMTIKDGAYKQVNVVEINNCDHVNGTSRGYTHRKELHQISGSVLTDYDVYRTSGFAAEFEGGTTNLARRMEPNTACIEGSPLRGIPIMSYIDATGSTTFTVEFLLQITGGATAPTALNDQELWLEIYYLDTADDAGWQLETTRSGTAGQYTDDPDAGGATNHTDTNDEANWTGEESSNTLTYSLSKTLTVNNKGLFMVVPVLEANETNLEVIYDPKVTIS